MCKKHERGVQGRMVELCGEKLAFCYFLLSPFSQGTRRNSLFSGVTFVIMGGFHQTAVLQNVRHLEPLNYVFSLRHDRISR